MSFSYNIYDHDKPALDETSYSLCLKYIVGLIFESGIFLEWGGNPWFLKNSFGSKL